MNTHKQKMLNELDEELFRLKFNIAHDAPYVEELESLKQVKVKESEEARAEIDTMNAVTGPQGKKKEHRDALKAKLSVYGKLLNAVKDYDTTIGQLKAKIEVAENKVAITSKKIEFLTAYEG